MNKEIEKLQEIIDDSENIVFFGGAGVSTESNIPDFLKCGRPVSAEIQVFTGTDRQSYLLYAQYRRIL